MLIMLVMCVLAAMLGGLLKGGAQRQTFILVGIAAPFAVVAVLSLINQIAAWRRKRKE